MPFFSVHSQKNPLCVCLAELFRCCSFFIPLLKDLKPTWGCSCDFSEVACKPVPVFRWWNHGINIWCHTQAVLFFRVNLGARGSQQARYQLAWLLHRPHQLHGCCKCFCFKAFYPMSFDSLHWITEVVKTPSRFLTHKSFVEIVDKNIKSSLFQAQDAHELSVFTFSWYLADIGGSGL